MLKHESETKRSRLANTRHPGGNAIPTRAASPRPRTEEDGVHVPLVDFETGAPTGEEYVIPHDQGDLAAHGPWFADTGGVYLIQKVVGTPHKLYVKAELDARACRCAVVADSIGPMHSAAGPSDGDNLEENADETDITDIVRIEILPPVGDRTQHLFRTHGLRLFDHCEFEVLAPGCFCDVAAGLLLSGACEVVFGGYRFEPGQIFAVKDVQCRLVEMPDESDVAVARLRIVDLPKDVDCALGE
jgi:hypothetical protein